MLKRIIALSLLAAGVAGGVAWAGNCVRVKETVCDTCTDSKGNTWSCNCKQVWSGETICKDE